MMTVQIKKIYLCCVKIYSSYLKDRPFRTGDEKISKELFELFFKRACSFANSLLRDDQLAYDIVQEAFIKIWKKNILCPSIISFKVYLYNTVRNDSYNYLQRKSIRHSDFENNKQEYEESVDQMIIAAEIEAELLKQIHLLPEARRNVILLRLEGMSIEEIAKELGLSVNTVKAHKKLAHKQLRESLKDLYIFLL
jgi:RNA polymerase sigma-70 factor (ECF subfamily)